MGEGVLFVSLLEIYLVNQNPEVGEVVEARIIEVRIDGGPMIVGVNKPVRQGFSRDSVLVFLCLKRKRFHRRGTEKEI